MGPHYQEGSLALHCTIQVLETTFVLSLCVFCWGCKFIRKPVKFERRPKQQVTLQAVPRDVPAAQPWDTFERQISVSGSSLHEECPWVPPWHQCPLWSRKEYFRPGGCWEGKWLTLSWSPNASPATGKATTWSPQTSNSSACHSDLLQGLSLQSACRLWGQKSSHVLGQPWVTLCAWYYQRRLLNGKSLVHVQTYRGSLVLVRLLPVHLLSPNMWKP